MPDIAQLVADRQAALARLVASERRAADAPIWLVGPGPAIEAAMPDLVSGVVVTSMTTGSGSCSRIVYYSNAGTGAEPSITVKTSGDACDALPPLASAPLQLLRA
jgi:hypothetical protein